MTRRRASYARRGVARGFVVAAAAAVVALVAIRQDGSDTIIAYAGYDLARLKETDAADLTRADVISYNHATNFALHWEYGL